MAHPPASSLPKLSIGLPVYSGEGALAEALGHVLAQSFGNFEIIISGNASTDSTSPFSREYANRDARIHDFPSDKNLGAIANFNWTFELSRAPLVKWAAHEDSTVVLARSGTTFLGEYGQAFPIDSDIETCLTSKGC
jgi:glycosyltransferase involved in cell wall biosynthesis